GLEEDATLVDRTLASGLSGSLSVAATFGQTAITLSSSTGFPESSVPNKAGYRVVLDRGNAGEEIITVLDNNAGTGVLSVTALGNNHDVGVSVHLLNDVLTFGALNNAHSGDS